MPLRPALRAARPLPPRRFLVLIFVRGWVDPQGRSATGRMKSIEKSNDIGNRTRDLPAFSIVSQPTTLQRAPHSKSYIQIKQIIQIFLFSEIIIWKFLCSMHAHLITPQNNLHLRKQNHINCLNLFLITAIHYIRVQEGFHFTPKTHITILVMHTKIPRLQNI
jgi:hypothetical protein